MTRRLGAVFAALVCLLCGGMIFAGPAQAHATVITTTPLDGARLKTAPQAVTMVFDEGVQLGNVGYLHVTDSSGRRVDAGAAFHPGGDATKVSDRLKSGLGDSTYTASFRVVSADSHPVTGTFRFVVGTGPLAQGSVSAGADTNAETTLAFAVSRWVSYAGLALLGGTWLVLTIWPAGRRDLRARRTMWAGWIGLAAGCVFELVLQGPYTAGLGPKLFDVSLIDDTLHTTFGQLHSVRLILLGLLAPVLASALQANGLRTGAWRKWALAALGIALTWTFVGAGHAATTPPSWLSVIADMAHLLAMATWLGGLAMLLGSVLPRREPDELRRVVPAFSSVAFAAVTVLVISGTYAAWRGVGTLDALFTTTYGLLVVCKVALLVAILAVAAFARSLVRRRVVAYAMTDAVLAEEVDRDDDPVRVERLRRAVYVETVIAFVVLAVSAVLVSEPRGKEALLASYRKPVSATAPLGGSRTVTVTADPGVHGPVHVTVSLSAGPQPEAVTAGAVQKQAQIGPLPIKLTRAAAGSYEGDVVLSVRGTWEIDLVVTSSQFAATTTDVKVTLH